MSTQVRPAAPAEEDRTGSRRPAGVVTPADLIDVSVVLLLTGLVLLGLDDSYATRAYLVTGMVGAGAVAAWALLCTVQAYPTGVFLLVAAVGFPVVGASVAMHDIAWLGFPSVAGIADLLTASFTAPAELLNTIPPVDAEGTVLVIPYLLGFALGGSSAAVALRTRRPALPVVPMLMGLALVSALGTEDPPALVARSVVFAVVVLLWVSLRAARDRAPFGTERGRALRLLSAVVLTTAAAVLTSVVLPPPPSTERLVLRGRVGSGQDVSQLDNPLAGFRRFTPQPAGRVDNVADRRLLKVSGLPREDLLRFVALDSYDGTTWAAGNRTVVDDTGSLFQRIGTEVGARRPGRHVRVGVEVLPAWTSSWLPLTGQLTRISFDFLDGRAQRKDVRYNVATETGMVVGGLQAKDDYTFSAIVPDSTLTRSMTAYGTGAPAQPEGVFLDRYLGPWKRSGLTPLGQVLSLATYLRVNGRFSDGGSTAERRYLPGHSSSRLGAGFVGARSIVGDDEQYAAFMALAANRFGVPARVVVGARPDRRGWVRGRNVLAWVEVRVADGSWRRLPPERYMSHKPPRRTDVVVSPQSFVRRTARPETTQSTPAQRSQQPRTTARDHGRRAAHALMVAVPLMLVLVGLVPFLKWLRRRRRRSAARFSRRVVGGWAEVLDHARDLGKEVPDRTPRTQQAQHAGLSVELARQADLLVFARDEPARADVEAFWSAGAAERRRLAGDAGRVRRVVAVWSPRSLPHAFSTRPPRTFRLGRVSRPDRTSPRGHGR